MTLRHIFNSISSLITALYRCDLIPVILTLFEQHQSNLFSACAQAVVNVITLLVRHSDVEVTSQMYEKG